MIGITIYQIYTINLMLSTNMQKLAIVIAAALAVTACSHSHDHAHSHQHEAAASMPTLPASLPVDTTALQHHHWQLTHIDNQLVESNAFLKAPTLEITEQMKVNGTAGCNQYMGQGSLDDDKLQVSQLAMTMKMCEEEAMQLERTFTENLAKENQVILTSSEMYLINDDHQLRFQLKDWLH
jgi:heat shock protein HslJ